MELDRSMDEVRRAGVGRLAPPRVEIVGLVEPGAVTESVLRVRSGTAYPSAALWHVAVGSCGGLLGRGRQRVNKSVTELSSIVPADIDSNEQFTVGGQVVARSVGNVWYSRTAATLR